MVEFKADFRFPASCNFNLTSTDVSLVFGAESRSPFSVQLSFYRRLMAVLRGRFRVPFEMYFNSAGAAD
jgi:hypothetical protein